MYQVYAVAYTGTPQTVGTLLTEDKKKRVKAVTVITNTTLWDFRRLGRGCVGKFRALAGASAARQTKKRTSKDTETQKMS